MKERKIMQDIAECMQSGWKDKARWHGIVRPYTPKDVLRLRGNLKIEYTLADKGAKRLWDLIQKKRYVHASGAISKNQAIEEVKAGSVAIYLSRSLLKNLPSPTEIYSNQSFSDTTSPFLTMPLIIGKVNNALQKADQIDQQCDTHWFVPIVAEAGFDGIISTFELTKEMISAGVSGIHFEDIEIKYVLPVNEFIQKLVAARLAADICGVPIILIAKTNADDAVVRGLAYAPYCDLIQYQAFDLEKAKEFADGIHAKYPDKLLAYSCSVEVNKKVLRFRHELAAMGYKFQFSHPKGDCAITESSAETKYFENVTNIIKNTNLALDIS
ncbi:MAG: hypothetical protein ACXAC5_03595 [Promethearchaeota archaeon]|jgi:isocitrate lyase